MCGIAGYLSNEIRLSADPDKIMSAMLSTLYSRGPDDEGVYCKDGLVLGMRRLVVLDELGGRQPMIDDSTGVVLVYNGELYNQKELRKELQQRGHNFIGYSDSEVVLRAYIEFGTDVAIHLNGMFAFCIWDPKPEKLFIFRDQLGQKPLYYYSADNIFVFGSDIRTILSHPSVNPEINLSALSLYFQYRNIPAPLTVIKNIAQLRAGTFLEVGRNRSILEQEYWRPAYTFDYSMTMEKASEKFEAIWERAIQRHYISDVPVGIFLSGGIDSSLVVSEAHRQGKQLQTFSMQFDDNSYNESAFANEVAALFESEHHVIPFSMDLLSLLKHWDHCYDQPFADPAMFPLMMLAKESRKSITVALTGDGGDELFGGYQRYRSAMLSRHIAIIPSGLRKTVAESILKLSVVLSTDSNMRRTMEAIGRRIMLINKDPEREYQNQFTLFSEIERNNLLVSPQSEQMAYYQDPDIIASMMLQDMQNWLPNQMLTKTDRATMGFSLEARLPFLDRELLDFALTIPSDLHFKNGGLKNILRKVANKHLPTQIANRKKHGFSVPVDSWLRKQSRIVDELIDDGSKRMGEYINPLFVKQLWNNHKTSKGNYGEKLLAIIIFFYWSRQYG